MVYAREKRGSRLKRLLRSIKMNVYKFRNIGRLSRMTNSSASNQLWFLNTTVTIRVAAAEGKDGMSILEHLLPYGDSPPLHIHRTQDEVFHVLEGEIRLKLGDQEK